MTPPISGFPKSEGAPAYNPDSRNKSKTARNIQVSKTHRKKRARIFSLAATVGFQLQFRTGGDDCSGLSCWVLIPFPFGLHFSRDGADDPKLRKENPSELSNSEAARAKWWAQLRLILGSSGCKTIRSHPPGDGDAAASLKHLSTREARGGWGLKDGFPGYTPEEEMA